MIPPLLNTTNVNSLGSVAANAALDFSPTVKIVTIIAFTALVNLSMNYLEPTKKKLNFAISVIAVPLGIFLGFALVRIKSSQMMLAQLPNNVGQGTTGHMLPVLAATMYLSVLATIIVLKLRN